MGARIITEAARLSFKSGGELAGFALTSSSMQRHGAQGFSQDALSGNMKMSVIYDGTSGQQGLPTTLAGNVAWMDAVSLFRMGNNMGPTFFNIGQVSCVIAGCQAPRNYAHDITAARVTELASVWDDLATLAPGASWASGGAIYSLLRFTFTNDGTKPGCVVGLTG